MLGKFKQPNSVHSEEHSNSVMPLIELDREWDDLRKRTMIYLVIAYGFSLLTCFSVIGQGSDEIDEQVIEAIRTIAPLFAIGLVLSSFSFVVYLVSAWISMRNRKRILSGEGYFIGWAESIFSQISGIIAGAAALLFSIAVAWGLLLAF